MTGRDLELSVVIPAFNEARRIVEPLRRIDAYLRAAHPASDVVVVDDGSTDETVAVVRGVAGSLATPVEVLAVPRNRGKGHAVKTGMLAARGRAVLTTDADLSTPIEALDDLLVPFTAGAPVVIGSRKAPGSRVEVHQPFLREAMGRVFTVLTAMLVTPVSDVTCGFKLFRRDAAQAIFARVTLDDWSYDAEVLFLARRLGFAVHEVPVRWRDVAGTKVHRGRDALRALAGLVRIRVNALRGVYALDGGARAPAATRR